MPHLQNPHVHLTAAMLVLHATTDDACFAAEAEALVDLCLGSFYDAGSGTLAETFDTAWTRHAGLEGIALEPGQHYEWVWILDQFLPAHANSGESARQAM